MYKQSFIGHLSTFSVTKRKNLLICESIYFAVSRCRVNRKCCAYICREVDGYKMIIIELRKCNTATEQTWFFIVAFACFLITFHIYTNSYIDTIQRLTLDFLLGRKVSLLVALTILNLNLLETCSTKYTMQQCITTS